QRERLAAAGLWDDAREAALQAELRAEVDAAVHAAEAMEDPLPGDVHTGVFAA
ncbi:MAG: 3-methyl-2-oxobutanoate dehydrogenase, partial [Chloroflexi bacterium CFX6]|nr:3-methyl-2-oxobutanoate dehydrogenase [Chloroflexi bacterium CFX6]